MTLDLNGTMDNSNSLAQRVEEEMKACGVTSVRISRNDEEAITVDGKLDDGFRLEFRTLFQEEKQYLILKRVHEGTLMYCNKVTLEKLPRVIDTLKFFAFPEKETEKEKPLAPTPPRKRWVMPVAVGVMALGISVFGFYLFQGLRTHCELRNGQEVIQP